MQGIIRVLSCDRLGDPYPAELRVQLGLAAGKEHLSQPWLSKVSVTSGSLGRTLGSRPTVPLVWVSGAALDVPAATSAVRWKWSDLPRPTGHGSLQVQVLAFRLAAGNFTGVQVECRSKFGHFIVAAYN